MKIDNSRAKQLRLDFPILNSNKNGKPIIYLDNGATTQKPQQVINAISAFYETQNANIHRGLYKLSQEATEAYEQAHAFTEKFINANPHEVIFTSGTTDSINMLAFTLPEITNGKNIVLTEMEHHANLVPWQQLAKRNSMKLKFIPIKDDFTLDYAAAEQLITEDTAIVSIVHTSNVLGTQNDAKRICALAKDNNAISIIDAAQSIPHSKIDVKRIDCDFLAFSGHKMCGPTGTGGLYGKHDLLEELPPYKTGGDMIRSVSKENAEWNDLPMKFEAGTPNIAGAIGLSEAITYLENIGMENIEAWEKQLLKYALEKTQEVGAITTFNPGVEKSAGILSFNIAGIHSHDLASLLDDDNICIRAGHHCAMPLMTKLGIPGTARASFYVYNTTEDIDALITGIKHTKQVFAKGIPK
ncbi:MAG: SufS family cysteine desulfurase [DPANN group archaeon]|nr:SufS family cysteine desulfurase [DPANN group archaeon]